MPQVVGDSRFTHYDGSRDPAVQGDQLLSTRGQLDNAQTRFSFEPVTSYTAAAVPAEAKSPVSTIPPTVTPLHESMQQRPHSSASFDSLYAERRHCGVPES
jgi:hypothetical protein